MIWKCKVIGLLIICLTLDLPMPTHGQFWKKSHTESEDWQREAIASRGSGICYKNQIAETLNPELRQREISYCCDGYLNRGSSKLLKCEPICQEDCTNGICLEPGVCECAPGYYRMESRCRKYDE
ncbi:uncharacterized protein LOC117782522 [Drosophila innubila]|uniref:uncharacterized protein LOC117782522 n=1 Tax=Drosophila innubila TaxID=198719 RepID=UPI00148BDC21|nr:uncharacterized protein LOC117782522 [Drosophila innubila]